MSSKQKPYTYVKRKFKYLEEWDVADLKLKIYTVINTQLPNDFMPPTAAVHKYMTQNLPQAVKNEGNSHDLGFVIIHCNHEHTWLLIHWWAHDDICCQLMALSNDHSSEFKSVDHRPLHACIWENKIINHENQAWSEAVLNRHPNTAEYLNMRFEDGNY